MHVFILFLWRIICIWTLSDHSPHFVLCYCFNKWDSRIFCFDPVTKPYVPQRLIRKADQWARDKWQRRPPPCSILLAQASSNSQQYSIGATNHLLHDQWTFPHHSVIMIELANIQSVIDLWGVGVLASSPTFEVQDSSLSAWCSISLVQKSQW